MTKKQHYMTQRERDKLEAFLQAGKGVSWIARELGFTRQTIYNEIKRGTYMHTCDYWEEPRYSADKGQDIQKKNARNKGRPPKVRTGAYLLLYLEKKMLRERRSPAAAMAEARKDGLDVCICLGTVYNYITRRRFKELTSIDLWERIHRKPREKSQQPKVTHPNLPSIEQRPESIGKRLERGHWEMDLVVSCQESTAALLTLTERVTREEIIIKVPNRQARTIRRAINRLERSTPNFREKFKTITTDNGSEFMEYDKLVRSVYGGKRFEVYYCHSYAAWEKGTNENHNRMIRRFFPKGTDFAKITNEQVAAVQNWMNGYPRKSLGWKSPNELKA